MEEVHKTRHSTGEGAQSFHALSGRATLPTPPCVHQPQSSLNPTLWGFLGSLNHVGMMDY